MVSNGYSIYLPAIPAIWLAISGETGRYIYWRGKKREKKKKKKKIKKKIKKNKERKKASYLPSQK